MARSLLLLSLAYSYLRICYAVPWIGAMETPIGIMAQAGTGMSPRPTEAPNLRGIPKELMPRGEVQFPPPDNWCGFVEGDSTNILSCPVTQTCVNSGTAVGCCDGINAFCTSLFTTCVGYFDACNAACQANTAVLKCATILQPDCGAYSFAGGSYLYLCDSTSQYLVSSVEYLADYYVTAIGSTLAPTTDPFANAKFTFASDSSSSEPTSSASSSSSSSSSDDDSDDDNTNTGLAAAAIGGIAAGAGLVICAILGLLIWCCLRRRKRARIAASQNVAQNAPAAFAQQSPPPMQQQTQPNYQPVPQQDSQYHGSGQFQPTQSGYFGGPTEPSKDNGAYTHVSPVVSPSLSKVDPVARPFSTVSSQPSESTLTQQHFSPPVAGYAGPLAGGAAQPTSHYKQPHSPTITEVDGTQGNPGVPHGYNGGASEVDGTQGNPGVPYAQHHNGPYEMH